MLVAMPVSAAAGFAVLRKWEVWLPAAALGGLIYGFSPYMVGQQLAHVELLLVPLPPLIAWTVASVLQRKGSPRRLGIRLGLLVAAQYLISPEVLAVTVVLTIVAVLFAAVRHRSQAVEVARGVWRPAVLAVVTAGVILAYPVWMMLAGPGHVTGSTWPAVNPYHNDLFSFGVPGPLQRVSLGLRSVGSRIAGPPGATEAGGYIGIPLLLVSALLGWRSRRSPRMQMAVGLLIVSAVLSLGPHLAIDGRTTTIPLPFLLLVHLPVFNDIIPVRISLEMFTCLAALVAFGLDDLRTDVGVRNSNVATVVTLAVAVVTLLPVWPPQGPYVQRPPTTLPAAIRRAIPDSTTLTYPYASLDAMGPMFWQAEDGFRFNLLGGYAYHPGPYGPDLYPGKMSPGTMQQFLASQGGFDVYGPPLTVTPALVSSAEVTLAQADVHAVIVDRAFPGSAPVVRLFSRALGPATLSAGGFSLWTALRLTAPLRPSRSACPPEERA